MKKGLLTTEEWLEIDAQRAGLDVCDEREKHEAEALPEHIKDQVKREVMLGQRPW